MLAVTPSHLLPCDQGPYIWDKVVHFEGIGSQFQWHKPSLFATHFLHGKWIGYLINEHHNREEYQSSYFGFNYSDCDDSSLSIYKDVHPNRFIHIPKEENYDYFLSSIRNQVTKKTVLIFDWVILDESHNYAVFDVEFRKRFHQQRLRRNHRIRRTDEFWVSIHFRWGDFQTNDPDKPNERTGLGLSEYCFCVKEIQRIKPQATIHFFAENLNQTKLCSMFQFNDNFHFYNDSMKWKRDLDIISQSQLILGGSSSFIVLGAHLCQNCTVIHDTKIKFAQTEYEKNLPRHMTDYFCNKELRCYTYFIIKSIS